MITNPNDDRVICQTCGQTVFQREVDVRHGTTTRRVVYQSHYELQDDRHLAALVDIDNFYAQCDVLESKLNGLSNKDRQVANGELAEFEVVAVKPTAHKPCTLALPVAVMRVRGETRQIELGSCVLADQTVDGLLAQFKKAAEPIIKQVSQ